MKYIYLIIILILLTGCQIDTSKFINAKNKLPLNETPVENITITNTTNITIVEPQLPELTGLEYYFFFENSLVIINSKTIVIDAGNNEALGLLTHYGKKADAVIVTLDTEEKAQGIKNLVLGNKPKIVYDNGLNTQLRQDYLKYAPRFNVSSERIIVSQLLTLDNTTKEDIEFFVPFENEFSFIKNENSIVVRYKDMLYMSNCYRECEKKIQTKAKYIFLANNGKCPTNSLDFILSTDATTVYGTELCDDLNELTELGISFVKIEKNTYITK